LRLSSGEAITGLEDLYQFAERIGGSEALLEAGLGESNASQTALVGIGSAIFLSRLLHNFDSLMFADSWWLPLDMQAKFSLTIGEIRAGSADERKHCAIRYLSGLAIEILGNAMLQLKAIDKGSGKNAGVHHVIISAAVTEKRLNKLKARPENYAQQGDGHVSEVISAWWQAIQG
jgi:phytoene/squalene synthetase